MVVIPTRTTSRSIDQLMRMCKAVFKNGHTKIAYVTKNGLLQGVLRLHGMV